MASHRMARGRKRADEILAFNPARRHAPRHSRRHGQIALAHRARLRGTQKRARPRPFRGAKLARIPPSRRPLHRRLRFSHPRTSGDSPLRPPAARNASPILASQTPRRRQSDPNGTSKIRSPRSEDNSRSRWREPSRAAPVAKPCHYDHLIADRRDTVELGVCLRNRGFCWRRGGRIGFCLPMSKRYRPWKIDEPMLLLATVQEFVDKDHLARFVLSLVVEEIDLEEIERVYRVERGQPPFDPAMMTALLLYGYCNGIYSSRRIAKACRERVDFMSIVGLDPADFRTISEFRKRHLSALSALFGQVLRLCEQAGLVKLGHVALDGTKIKANASKHKAMSYERMGKRAEELEAEVAAWMDVAAKADASEDAAFGCDKSGEEMPAWVGDKKRRAEKIRAAKAELEAEARAAAKAERKARAEAEKKREAEGRKKPGKPAAPPSEDPDPKAQKNFTDPESRIMKTKDGFIQGYNAQAAVDAAAQVIVAHGLDANGSDQHQLMPMVDAVEANMGRRPEEVSADAGYCSDANLAAMEERAIDAYIAAGRAKHPTEGEGGSKRVADMREKIKAGGHKSPYRLRKQLPEPVFGQIKQARGFRQFLMRGLDKVAHEWGLVCLAHNMLKLAQGRSPSAAELATA